MFFFLFKNPEVVLDQETIQNAINIANQNADKRKQSKLFC